jgi:peroxiredoxin
MSHRVRLPLTCLGLGLLLTSAVAQESSSAQPVVPGGLFPASTFANLNAAAGGNEQIDLAQYLGKKPIILYYWIATNSRSEKLFLQLQDLVQDVGADHLALFGVAVPRPPALGEEKIRERLGALGIRVPVLDDAGFRIGKQLLINSVPNITVIDAGGRLRLSNGASLAQVLGYELDLGQAIRRTAETGQLMTYGYLDRYYPVRELEGEKCPDFTAPLLKDSVERRWHSLLDDSKVNVLIFWSVDCGHCRKSLPEINAWLKGNPDGVNVVSCASVTSETVKTKTREFCELNDFRFLTLVDGDAEISDLYRVTSTPTIVIIRPDGVVDSAIVSGHSDFVEAIEKRRKKLLGITG